MGNDVELTPETIENAMKFLSVPWLTRKELWSLDMARGQPTIGEAMIHEDEAGRCRSTIIQLSWLRTQLATANAENARLSKARDEAEAKHAILVKECDSYELRLGQMARAKAKPQHDAVLAAMDKAADTLEGILTSESDTAKQLTAANERAVRAERFIETIREELTSNLPRLNIVREWLQTAKTANTHHDLDTPGVPPHA